MRKPEVYLESSGLFCADLDNAGISVVRGEEHRPQLLPDGMHGTASSGGVVQDILADMVMNAREVIVSARDVQSPKWWQWVGATLTASIMLPANLAQRAGLLATLLPGSIDFFANSLNCLLCWSTYGHWVHLL